MSTSVCDVFPIVVFGSVVGFQSVRFLFSYMIWYLHLNLIYLTHHLHFLLHFSFSFNLELKKMFCL